MKRRLALCHLTSFAILAALGACSGSGNASKPAAISRPANSTVAAGSASAATVTPSLAPPDTEPSATTTQAVKAVALYDSAVVHELTLEYDQTDFDAIVAQFREDGTKGWIEVTVTIDRAVYRQAGLRFKGNSSLFGLGGKAVPFPQPIPAPNAPLATAAVDSGDGRSNATAETPERLPWLIRLDKYVKDQSHQGTTDFVVRSNGTDTALNEALALELLNRAGLTTQKSMSVRMSVNGGEPVLRLVVQNLNDQWANENFGKKSLLYKAAAKGDYTYRGTDPADYASAWDQDAGKANLTPLIEFLDFVNNSSDQEFAANLAARLDVQSLATYIALEELMQNFDDLDGPGNNSYLAYQPSTKLFTVVAWDHNFAFTQIDDVMKSIMPPGIDPSLFPPGRMAEILKSVAKPNPLAIRFKEVPEFLALYEKALLDVRAELFDSGTAKDLLATLSTTLLAGAGDLVDTETVNADIAYITEFFPSGG